MDVLTELLSSLSSLERSRNEAYENLRIASNKLSAIEMIDSRYSAFEANVSSELDYRKQLISNINVNTDQVKTIEDYQIERNELLNGAEFRKVMSGIIWTRGEIKKRIHKLQVEVLDLKSRISRYDDIISDLKHDINKERSKNDK